MLKSDMVIYLFNQINKIGTYFKNVYCQYVDLDFRNHGYFQELGEVNLLFYYWLNNDLMTNSYKLKNDIVEQTIQKEPYIVKISQHLITTIHTLFTYFETSVEHEKNLDCLLIDYVLRLIDEINHETHYYMNEFVVVLV